MKSIVISLCTILGILVISALVFVGIRNDIIGANNQVTNSWADVQSVYQRRLDVFPKMAEVAKFSIKTQVELNTVVPALREGYKSSATPKDIEKVDGRTAQILVNARAEAVPTLNTTQLTELNGVIDSIERAINHQRDAFNSSVRNYNNKIMMWPGSWVASTSGFAPKESFTAQPGAERSPDLKLGDTK